MNAMSKSDEAVSMDIPLVEQSKPVLDLLQQLIDDLDGTSSFSFASHEKYFFLQLYNNVRSKLSDPPENKDFDFSAIYDLISTMFKESVEEIQRLNKESMELIWKDGKVKEMLLDVLANTLFNELNGSK